jgi:hypothetical protein
MPHLRKHDRRVRISFEAPPEYIWEIYQFIKDERSVTHIETKEVTKTNGAAPPSRINWRPQHRQGWRDRVWALVEPVFHAANGKDLAHDEPELRNAMIAGGMQPSSLSTAFTEFVRLGKIERVSRGRYRLVMHP